MQEILITMKSRSDSNWKCAINEPLVGWMLAKKDLTNHSNDFWKPYFALSIYLYFGKLLNQSSLRPRKLVYFPTLWPGKLSCSKHSIWLHRHQHACDFISRSDWYRHAVSTSHPMPLQFWATFDGLVSRFALKEVHRFITLAFNQGFRTAILTDLQSRFATLASLGRLFSQKLRLCVQLWGQIQVSCLTKDYCKP